MTKAGYRLTRWADDFVIVCRTRQEAEAALATARAFLHERLGVSLHPEKTRIVHITNGFEFLGYKIRKGKGLKLSARGPNSMRPCIQPTAWPPASDAAVPSIMSSSDATVKRAPALARRLSISACVNAGPKKGPRHNIAAAVGIALLAEKYVPDRESRPDRAAGITGGRLHPDALKCAVAQQLAIGDAVERDATGQAEVPQAVFARKRASQPQHHLLSHCLDRGGDVHVEWSQ
jgi:hypothetical protein